MQDFFYEESSKMSNERSGKTKYYIFKTLSIVSYVLFALWLLFFVFSYDLSALNGGIGQILLSLLITLLPAGFFLASGIVLGKFKDRFYVDYDYTLVSGSIRFSKIIKEIKRKNITAFEASEIEKIGKYGSELFEKYAHMPDVKTVILTSNETPEEKKDFYYMVVSHDGEKKLYVLECTELFIVNVLKFAKRTVIDEELKKQK